jgi:hypothetical protein
MKKYIALLRVDTNIEEFNGEIKKEIFEAIKSLAEYFFGEKRPEAYRNLHTIKVVADEEVASAFKKSGGMSFSDIRMHTIITRTMPNTEAHLVKKEWKRDELLELANGGSSLVIALLSKARYLEAEVSMLMVEAEILTKYYKHPSCIKVFD